MTIIASLLDWRVINLVSPFIGLAACAYILLSCKTSTSRKAVSSAISLSIMLWLMLVWADWGSVMFVASYQTMWSRLILLIVSILIMYELHGHTRITKRLATQNAYLNIENKRLRDFNDYLLSKYNKDNDL